jgi:hypothetical protein
MRKKKDNQEDKKSSNRRISSKQSSHYSILQKHDEKMLEFSDKNTKIKEINITINKYNKELEELRKKARLDSINCDILNYETHAKIKTIEDDIINLEKEKENVSSGKNENDYILATFDIINEYIKLEEYEQELLNRPEGTTESIDDIEQLIYDLNIKKKDVVDQYLKIMDPAYITTRQINNTFSKNNIFCKNCNNRLEIDMSNIVCNNCGLCLDCPVITGELSYKQIQEFDYRPQFKYDKMTHLDEWLRRFQAKEHKAVSQEILDIVLMEAKKERITNLNNLTEEKVKKYLKKRDLNGYYDNVIAIINRINKRPPFVLTPEIEQKIKEMFQQIQVPFEKYKAAGRKNMLSYSYLLHQFFLILGLPEFSKYFFLLKSPEKLRQQDETFKKIVDEMAKKDKSINWKFYPSI